MIDEPGDEQVRPSEGLARVRKYAGLLILAAIVAIVVLRVMASWIKWLLIAVVVGAAVYLIKRLADAARRE